MNSLRIFLRSSILLSLLAAGALSAQAATLRLNPGTGVYTVGNTFTAAVLINTDGKSINAADGQLSFNPRELQVVSVTRGSSIFNLWTEEPAFSNSAGTISFGGGSPTGYKGSAGNVVTISFRPLAAGTPKVNFKNGSILAADGMGTNILTGMSGGTYTVSAKADTPEPEYIAPANTPKAPVIASESHPDAEKWYTEKTAKLSWTLPSDVTSVRMLLDDAPSTIPTNVYDERITSKTIEDLDEGEGYFHLQFKNADGWGKVAHYRLAVDTEPPQEFTVSRAGEGEDVPGTTLVFDLKDASPIAEYRIQIDGGDPVSFVDEKEERTYVLPALEPGHHTVVVEAIDSAGNSSVASHSFMVETFEKPVFTEFPSRINTEVIPAIKGKTRPDAYVAIEVRRASDNAVIHTVEAGEEVPGRIVSDAEGEFMYIPDSSFEVGVYTITARAMTKAGMYSDVSDPIKMIVEVPGYIAFGNSAVSLLSVIVPLIALAFLGAFGTWYLWFKFKIWTKRVRKETREVGEELALEFKMIVRNLDSKVRELHASRKGKLTKAELALIEQIQADLKEAEAKIKAEVKDIEDIIA